VDNLALNPPGGARPLLVSFATRLEAAQRAGHGRNMLVGAEPVAARGYLELADDSGVDAATLRGFVRNYLPQGCCPLFSSGACVGVDIGLVCLYDVYFLCYCVRPSGAFWFRIP